MSAWPPTANVIASEGADMSVELRVDQRHGVVTDDLLWGKPRSRRTQFRKTDAMRPRAPEPQPAAPAVRQQPKDGPR